MRVALATTPRSGVKSSYAPLGLGYLAAAAEAEGHEVRIYDFGLVPGLEAEAAAWQIEQFDPDILGLSIMTSGYFQGAALARVFKERSGCPVVFGGPHPSIFPEDCLRAGADFVICGEGEQSFVRLLKAAESAEVVEKISSGDLEQIAGLFWLDNEAVKQGPPAERLSNLDSVAPPARHLFNILAYPLTSEDGRLMTNMITSRGCPFSCTYCHKGIFGNRCRALGAEAAIREIKQILDLGIDRIYFTDDLFTFDRRRVIELCGLIKELGSDLRWQCLSRVDLVDDEILAYMADAGCEMINYGIESGDPEILKRIGKKITLDRVEKTIRSTKLAGIKTKGYFMIGLPGDNDRSIRRTMDLACRLDLDHAMFSLTTPLPGTRLSREAGLDWSKLIEKFEQASYYTEGSKQAKVFCNLSAVSDEALLNYLDMAKNLFSGAARRRRLQRRFGPVIGTPAAWVAESAPLRNLGKKVIHGS